VLKVAVAGCQGRMGQALIYALKEAQITLAAGSVRKASAKGQDIGKLLNLPALFVNAVTDLSEVIDDFDVLIDFTTPSATLLHLALCRQHQKKMVIGTTGLNQQQQALVQSASQDIALVFSPNMSIGVNVCLGLLQKTAKVLGESDIEIIEAHHRQKQDAPSGTALKMAECIKSAATTAKVGFSSLRVGDTPGEHTVLFACQGERVEISHRAFDRQIFAKGAILAAKWLTDKAPGFYTMQEVIGL